jgi:hypothetical protein
MKFNSYSFKRFFSPASKLLVYIGLATAVAGCQWGDEVESLVQTNPDNFQVLFSDTSTVLTSTVIYDSVMTGGPSRLLLGRYVDPLFGPVQATTFIQPTLLNSISLPDGAVYDSLVLSLHYEKTSESYPRRTYTYGDTTKLMTVGIHALQADIMTKNSYYNENATGYDSLPLGKKTFYPRPYSERTLNIKLSNTLGQQIFDKAKSNLLSSNEDWLTLLKGLAVVPQRTDNGAIVGFTTSQDSTSVKLHYHTTGTDDVTKGVHTFRVSAAYNQIIADRSKTPLAGLKQRRIALPSSATGERTFIQEGTGVLSRIDIPYIRSLKDIKYSVSNRAFLRVTPLRQSVTKLFPAPPVAYLYLANKNNEFLTPLLDLKGGAVTGRYVVDLINNTEFYSFDVSKYVTDLLNSNRLENEGLLMVTSQLGKYSQQYLEAQVETSMGVRRLVFGSQKNTSDRGIKLELYYTTVKAESK